MFLGIDLGTSELKVLLMGDDGETIGTAQRSLRVSRPQPRWAEQDPAMWWMATQEAIESLQQNHKVALSTVRAIGLSGQMHGATLLDRSDRVLRRAILWNDTRSDAECARLTERAPNSEAITGNLIMPGFTAPKLLWVANHEPEIFSQISSVLLPKDFLRLCMTGEKISDMSDASGTLWLDVANRKWSSKMLEATGLTETHMPSLVEGSNPGGFLRRELASRWGIKHPVVVAGGAGDNAASAVGIGANSEGDGFISLGTSGVVFVSGERFRPNPHSGVHAFCHALPHRWHQMSVMLSAASCLQWVTKLSGAASEAALLRETAAAGPDIWRKAPVFLPYLSGERTPHNDPFAQGVFFGLTHETDRAALGYAVLEGVAFGLADGLEALVASGTEPKSLALVGGGSRSDYWAQLISSVLGVRIVTHSSGQAGAVVGAARLAAMAAGAPEASGYRRPATLREYQPDPESAVALEPRKRRFRTLYPLIKPLFANSDAQ